MRAAHTEIQICRFIKDGVFATKRGNTGVALQIHQFDSECMDEKEKDAVTDRWRAGINDSFGPDFTLYQYFLKRKAPKGLYQTEAWLVVVRSGINSRALVEAVDTFVLSMKGSLSVAVAGRKQMNLLLRKLVNYDAQLAAHQTDYREHVDYFTTDSSISADSSRMLVGEHTTCVMTLKSLPRYTISDMLKPLRNADTECTVVTEWKQLPPAAARALVMKKSGEFHKEKYSSSVGSAIFTAISGALGLSGPVERADDMQKDQGAIAMEGELGDLMVEIEKQSVRIGEFALTVVVFDVDPKRAKEAADKVRGSMLDCGAVLFAEMDNPLAPWFAHLPDGRLHQRRAQYLTCTNYSGLSLLFAPPAGIDRTETLTRFSGRETRNLTELQTRYRTEYKAVTHFGDVPHVMISGQNGSGKSVLAAHLIEHAIERYDARVLIVDMGGSYRAMCERMGGSYVTVGVRNEFTINPFSVDNRAFRLNFVKVLVERGGYKLGIKDRIELNENIDGNKTLSDLYRKLLRCPSRGEKEEPTLMVPHLAPWVHHPAAPDDPFLKDGEHCENFDNAADTFTFAKLKVMDFEAVKNHPEIIEPMLYYILSRATPESSDRANHKVFMLDEAWKFLMSDIVRDFVYEGLKTWRKENAALWIATQSIDDLSQSKMLRTVAEQCGYLIMLPNPRMDPEQYREVFKLNDTELGMIAGGPRPLMAKLESMWKPAVGPSTILQLHL